MHCYRRFAALSESQRDKMQRAKEIDITNMNTNEEHTYQSGFSLMAKRSEINLPNHQELEYSQVYGCFAANPPRKVKGIEQKLANVETNDFEKQVRKYIE